MAHRCAFGFFVISCFFCSLASATFTLTDVIEDPGVGLGTRGVASCDADEDGVKDFVVGNIYDSNLRGAVRIYSGVTNALLATIKGPQANGLFGDALIAIGDLNGDQAEELFVGAPGDGVSQGYLLDCVQALSALTSPIIHTFSSPNSFDQFGSSAAVILEPTSGTRALIVGAPAAPKPTSISTSGPGQAHIYRLNPKTASTPLSVSGSLYVISGPADDSSLGYELASGDIDNDLFEDLLIGVPRYNGGSGMVRAFDGVSVIVTALSSGSIPPTAFSDLQPPVDGPGGLNPGTIQFGQEFGAALDTGYFAGLSQAARVVVGARYYSVVDLTPMQPPLIAPQTGRVLVAKYNPGGDNWDFVYEGLKLTTGANHNWGWDVAVVGDADGALGASAIVVGGPGNAGAVSAGGTVALLGDETSAIPFSLVDFQPPGIENAQRGIAVSNIGVLAAGGRPSLSIATAHSVLSNGYEAIYEVPLKQQLTSKFIAAWMPTNKMGCAKPSSGLMVPEMGMSVLPKIGNPLSFTFDGFPPNAKILFGIGSNISVLVELSSDPSLFNCFLSTLPYPGAVYFPIQANGSGHADYTVKYPDGTPFLIDPIFNGFVVYAQAGVLTPSPGFGFDYLSKQIEIRIGN